MAFVWEPLLSATASSYSEMRDAVNSITDAKNASRFNWQSLIPAKKMMVKASRYDELQDATDYADDVNFCNSDHANYYITKDEIQNTVDDSTEDVNQDGTDYTTVYSNQDNGYDGTLYATIDTDKYDSQHTTQDVGHDSTLHSTVDAIEDISFYETADNGYDAALHTQVDDNQHATYDGTKDIDHDSSRYVTVDNDEHGTYNTTQDAGYDGTLNTTVDSDQHGTYNTAEDLGYDSPYYISNEGSDYGSYDNSDDGTVNGTKNSTVYSSADSSAKSNYQAHESGSCFTGRSLTITEMGRYVRVDSVKAGDYLMGANGETNRVVGVERVLVGKRTLFGLNSTDARFTGEHPFLMADGRWGAFDKEAMDREIFGGFENIVVIDSNKFIVVGDLSSYDDSTVTQLENGDLGVDINGDHIPLSVVATEDKEEYVYTMLMDGSRTWNIEGIVISGLALSGESPRLEAYIEH